MTAWSRTTARRLTQDCGGTQARSADGAPTYIETSARPAPPLEPAGRPGHQAPTARREGHERRPNGVPAPHDPATLPPWERELITGRAGWTRFLSDYNLLSGTTASAAGGDTALSMVAATIAGRWPRLHATVRSSKMCCPAMTPMNSGVAVHRFSQPPSSTQATPGCPSK
jgi:hypothetical protein